MNNKELTILAIETSCDETSVAIIKDKTIISNIILTSAKEQATYGGVIPELAARRHENNIIKALKLALDQNQIKLDDINYIAYTSTPGLRVCLNVGEICAYTLANMTKAQLIPINHLYGHIFSFYDFKQQIVFPFISLIVSGGNTILYLVKDVDDITILNQTSDDAIGECYDKVARALGLAYPGGPKIDKLYDETQTSIKFIHKKHNDEDSFSFSGLKTAVLNYINQLKMKNKQLDIVSIASSFQKQAINMLIDKLNYYVNKYQVNAISIGGGVAANNYLRKQINKLKVEHKYIADKNMCGDNALMIAIYAYLKIIK